MKMSFPQYVRVKDNYCCNYIGNSPDYVAALRLLKPQIESQLPGLKFFISCRRELYYLLEGEPDTFPGDKLNVLDFAYVREISNKQNSHSIMDLIVESDLNITPVIKKSDKKTGLCLICPEGVFPVKSLERNDLEGLKERVKLQGYTPIVVGSDVHYSLNIDLRPSGIEKLNYINEAAWVVGVENEYLFLGASHGLRSTMLGKSVGEQFYKMLFPLMEFDIK